MKLNKHQLGADFGRVAAAALLLLLAACGKVAPVHYYDLRYPGPAASAAATTSSYTKTLAVANFSAPSLYRQTRVLYRDGQASNKVGYYEDRRWTSPPTELLTQSAITHFRNSNLFANVTPFMDRSACDYVLRTRILELEEVDLPDGYYGKTTLQAELVSSESGQILWSGAVSASRKTSVRDADAVIEELAISAQEALGKLVQAVEQALSRASGS